ncbi:hypothetical protein KR018_008017 [Drosophila ironensis]|nr:hypothetical protein KR018_008017 [Drosophila ironensis]
MFAIILIFKSVMWAILRRTSVPKLTAAILRKYLTFIRCMGVVHFRIENKENGLVSLDDNRKWRKWLYLIHAIVCILGFDYMYSHFIFELECDFEKTMHVIRMVLQSLSQIWFIRMNILLDPELTSLVNQMWKLFRRVRSLSNHKRSGFGGGPELVMVIFMVLCHIQEFSVFSRVVLNWNQWFVYWCDTYVVVAGNIIVHICFLWHLSLSVLCVELNEILQLEMIANRRFILEECLAVYTEVHKISILFRKLFHKQLFTNMTLTILYIAMLSYQIIIKETLTMDWIWIWFTKIMLDQMLLCLSVQRILNEFGKLRLLILELMFLSDQREWQQNMYTFVTYLNLYNFRIRILGLFEVSNKLFLIILSGMIAYLIFIMQSVMQLRLV